MRYLIAIFILTAGLSKSVSAQDSSSFFLYEQFLEIVREHHPVAYQAALTEETGALAVQKAKGAFDPKLVGTASQKYFDGKQYYSYLHGGLKIPTWFGITVDAGYNNNDGVRLNPESYNVDAGIWHAGISVNLGKGLFIDERRADIQQSKIIRESTVLERRLMVNQLMFDASIAYFNWFKAYNKVKVYERALINATQVYNNTKQSTMLGDKAAVDTVKAMVRVQERQLKLEQSRMDLINKRLFLDTYLWQDGFIPLELDETVTPVTYDLITFQPTPAELLLDTMRVDSHPDILMSQNKIATTKIDYRLKRESLKPTLQLKYNALSSDLGNGVINDYSFENYAWGAKFSYPIFTRKERADVSLYDIKLDQQRAELENKRALVKYKIDASRNFWLTSATQIDILLNSVGNYEILYISEITLFNAGESSMFLVNTREKNWIDAQIKLIDLLFYNKEAMSHFKFQTVAF